MSEPPIEIPAPPWHTPTPTPTPTTPTRGDPQPAQTSQWGDETLYGLRARRRLLLTGTLEEEAVTRVAAELMLLDGVSSDPVELTIYSQGGPASHASALIDVLALMRAPVTTRCIGMAAGTAAVVLASGTGTRTATPNARISLRIDDRLRVEDTAAGIARAATAVDAIYDGIAAHLARVSALDVDAARHALDAGAPMDVDEALRLHLIDTRAP